MSSSSPSTASPSTGDTLKQTTTTIVLATTIPAVLVILLVSILCYRLRRKRRARFHRGLTPINDDEIESWKVNKGEEKSSVVRTRLPHQASDSESSVQKPGSVIIYHKPSHSRGRLSEDHPSRYMHDYDLGIEMPETAVAARAPNARPGLTDEAIEGDDAYIARVKRQPSRLSKAQPGPSQHRRTRSSRSSVGMGISREQWHGQTNNNHTSPRPSGDRGFESPMGQTRFSYDEDDPIGLSPRPLIQKVEVGRAAG